ncbi:NUDIX hydrolase [Primorskyibacter sp. S87]|uniref:NUDIX hydrolase n=1 Tax=Primorskyibacter sp. S87 TaxID=3415126 RepID=UPI003C7CBCF8
MKMKHPAKLIRSTQKEGMLTQFGALCYRIDDGKPQVLLVTSRGTGRWILPKGRPIEGLNPAETAAQEAWEEAGVVGKPRDHCLGFYPFEKDRDENGYVPCAVLVYPVRVQKMTDDFPERGQRRIKWFSRKKAASAVGEPELSRILLSFDPRRLR